MAYRNKVSKVESNCFFKSLIPIISLYWGSQERAFAWFAILTLLALSILGVVSALAINEWYKNFYNAIQDRDVRGFYSLIGFFVGISIFCVARLVAVTYLVDLLALKWRRWLTRYYISKWGSASARAHEIEWIIDNPDQRIAEDIKKFTFESLDLLCGLIYTAVSIISFSFVLVEISGEASVWGVTVPAHMFWAAILYAFFGTYICQRIGSSLVLLSNDQQRSEADLRFELVSFRSNSLMQRIEKINCSRKASVMKKLEVSLTNMRQVIMVKSRLTLFSISYNKFCLIFSSMLAVPRFFAGSLSFGDIMQINSAFGNLCENLCWFISAYERLAAWKATTQRLLDIDKVLIECSGGAAALNDH
ncbi:SbmA/BacA-like family transporter [Pseudomonas sp. nanlin1]|uniref:SbmA/BacA-like family transporter n=1 Tax=Pseudomonas sp. nanlin1 TaxID=3040605 RepID=UPI003890A7F7